MTVVSRFWRVARNCFDCQPRAWSPNWRRRRSGFVWKPSSPSASSVHTSSMNPALCTANNRLHSFTQHTKPAFKTCVWRMWPRHVFSSIPLGDTTLNSSQALSHYYTWIRRVVLLETTALTYAALIASWSCSITIVHDHEKPMKISILYMHVTQFQCLQHFTVQLPSNNQFMMHLWLIIAQKYETHMKQMLDFSHTSEALIWEQFTCICCLTEGFPRYTA